MIYVDTSVLLAQLLAEDRRPPAALWDSPLIASRLAEYELWTRIHARRVAASHGDAAAQLLARVSLVELAPPVLRRALEPFPEPVRTLDALHLATLEFLRSRRLQPRLASYDQRLLRAAATMSISLDYRSPHHHHTAADRRARAIWSAIRSAKRGLLRR